MSPPKVSSERMIVLIHSGFNVPSKRHGTHPCLPLPDSSHAPATVLSVGNGCLLQRIVGLILYNSPYVLQSLSQDRYLPWLNIHGNLGAWKCIPMKTLFFIINSRPLILLLWVHYSLAAETKLSLSSFLWYFSKGTTQESCVISPFSAQDGLPPTEVCLILQSSLQSKVHMTLVFNLFPKDFVFLACSVQKPTEFVFVTKITCCIASHKQRYEKRLQTWRLNVVRFTKTLTYRASVCKHIWCLN